MRCPYKARRIQTHSTVQQDQDTGRTARNTFFLFFLSLTPSWPYKYSLCLGAGSFSVIPHLNHSPSHLHLYLIPVSFLTPCPKLPSHFMTFDLCLFPVSGHIFFCCFSFFLLSLMVSLFWILIKLLLIPCFLVICRKKTENIWGTPLVSLYFSLAPLAIEKRKLRASPAQISKPQERVHLLHTESLKKW